MKKWLTVAQVLTHELLVRLAHARTSAFLRPAQPAAIQLFLSNFPAIHAKFPNIVPAVSGCASADKPDFDLTFGSPLAQTCPPSTQNPTLLPTPSSPTSSLDVPLLVLSVRLLNLARAVLSSSPVKVRLLELV